MTQSSSFEELQEACRRALGVELDPALAWEPILPHVDMASLDCYGLHDLSLWKTGKMELDPLVESAAHQLLGAALLDGLARRQDMRWDRQLLSVARAWSDWGSLAIEAREANILAHHVRGLMDNGNTANQDQQLALQLAYLCPKAWLLNEDVFRAKLPGFGSQRNGMQGKPPGGSLGPDERDVLYRYCYDEFAWNSVDELMRFATLSCSARIPKGNLPHLLGVLTGPHARPWSWAMGLDKRLDAESTATLVVHGPTLMDRLSTLPWNPQDADCWGLWCIVDAESYRWQDLGIAHARVLDAHPVMKDAVERIWSPAAALHDGHERSRAAHRAYRETSTLSFPLPSLDEEPGPS